MSRERSGRGVVELALLVSLIALGISLLAYQEARGNRVLQQQLRTLQGALDLARRESAEALARLERAVRPPRDREGLRASHGGERVAAGTRPRGGREEHRAC